jgi:4-hydroxy-4-methyl-2-oxoglutarate aldolase
VMVVARSSVPEALKAAQARVVKEEAARAAFRSGELGLDRYGMRPLLDKLGVQYVTAEEYARSEK